MPLTQGGEAPWWPESTAQEAAAASVFPSRVELVEVRLQQQRGSRRSREQGTGRGSGVLGRGQQRLQGDAGEGAGRRGDGGLESSSSSWLRRRLHGSGRRFASRGPGEQQGDRAPEGAGLL